MNQLEPLTGLRGIAAYSILIAYTIAAAFSYDGSILQPFAQRLAYFGMSLFSSSWAISAFWSTCARPS
jgi:hypothetical protein